MPWVVSIGAALVLIGMLWLVGHWRSPQHRDAMSKGEWLRYSLIILGAGILAAMMASAGSSHIISLAAALLIVLTYARWRSG